MNLERYIAKMQEAQRLVAKHAEDWSAIDDSPMWAPMHKKQLQQELIERNKAQLQQIFESARAMTVSSKPAKQEKPVDYQRRLYLAHVMEQEVKGLEPRQVLDLYRAAIREGDPDKKAELERIIPRSFEDTKRYHDLMEFKQLKWDALGTDEQEAIKDGIRRETIFNGVNSIERNTVHALTRLQEEGKISNFMFRAGSVADSFNAIASQAESQAASASV